MEMEMKKIVIDGRNHLLDPLASRLADDLLKCRRNFVLVVLRCEEIRVSGKLDSVKTRYSRFRFQALPPSKIVFETIRGLIPPKGKKRGEAELARLEVYDGVPPPYDKLRRSIVPGAGIIWDRKNNKKYCLLGRLSSEFGAINRYDAIWEEKKKRDQICHEWRKKLRELNKLRGQDGGEKMVEVDTELHSTSSRNHLPHLIWSVKDDKRW